MTGAFTYRLCLFLLLTGILWCVEGMAQSVPMIQYTTEDGLPSNNVYNVFRDKKGFLWFATDKGVARYNGVNFEQYTVADGLPDNEIFQFREDFEGRIWMQTYNGKLCYYKEGKLYSEKNMPFLKLKFNTHTTNGIDIGDDESIIFLFEDRTRFINIIHDRVKSYDVSAIHQQYGRMVNVRKLSNNRILLQCKQLQVCIDTTGRIVYTKPYLRDADYESWSLNTDLTPNKNNRFLVSGNAVYSWDEQFFFSFPENVRKANDYRTDLILIFWDRSREFYCTHRGLFLSTGEYFLRGKSVTSICRDNNGDYWISTYRHGVYHCPGKIRDIVTYDGVSDGRFISPLYFNRKFYFASYKELNPVMFSAGKNRVLFRNSIPDFLPETDRQLPIAADSNTIYFQTFRGLYQVKDFVPRLLNVNLKQAFFRGLYCNSRYLYGVINNRVVQYNLDSIKKGHRVNGEVLMLDLQFKRRIMSRGIDDYGCLWYCTQDSVYRLRGSLPVVQRQFSGISFRKILCNGNYMIGYDAGNILYVYRLFKDTAKLIRNFHNNRYFWGDIFSAGSNKVIISTNTYYQLLNLNDTPARCYMQPLEDPFIPRNASYVYTDSTFCYFAKDGAITRIPMSYIYRTSNPPVVLFTQLRVKDKSYNIGREITLSSSQSGNISIGFEGISFGSRELSYQYVISENLEDSSWSDIEGKSINLAAPGFGTYYVKLRAKTLSSKYSAPVTLSLVIERPFWLSWWFIALMAGLALALVFLTVRSIVVIILRRRRRMHELESRYQTAEYKTLNALMNPHFIFNSLNNIKGLVNRDDKKGANKFLTSFSSVVRQNMQNLSKETVSLYEEIELISKYLELERLRYGEYINYKIDISRDVDAEEVLIPPLLIQPLVENAVKHGLLPRASVNNMITVSVYNIAQSTFIEVRDNGVGLSRSVPTDHEGYESLGLQNIEKRISYLRQSGRQQLYFSIREIVEHGQAAGTMAVIEIIH